MPVYDEDTTPADPNAQDKLKMNLEVYKDFVGAVRAKYLEEYGIDVTPEDLTKLAIRVTALGKDPADKTGKKVLNSEDALFTERVEEFVQMMRHTAPRF